MRQDIYIRKLRAEARRAIRHFKLFDMPEAAERLRVLIEIEPDIPEVIVSIRGGSLETMASDSPVAVRVWDFDNITEGGGASDYPAEPFDVVGPARFRALVTEMETERAKYLDNCGSCGADLLGSPMEGCRNPDTHDEEA